MVKSSPTGADLLKRPLPSKTAVLPTNVVSPHQVTAGHRVATHSRTNPDFQAYLHNGRDCVDDPIASREYLLQLPPTGADLLKRPLPS